MTKRNFANITDQDVALNRQLQFAKNTTYSSVSSFNQLLEFHQSQPQTSTSSSFVDLRAAEMNALLERFYLSCRTKKGEDYKATTLRTIRQNLRRCIRESHKYDILEDIEFNTSNTIFKNKMKSLKAHGKGTTEHHPDISDSDLKKIVAHLSIDDPGELQLLAWFYIQLYFCRRGLENLAELQKDHYEIKLINGRSCITQKTDELTKNHRENDVHRVSGAIVIEQNHDKCPVQVLKKYLSKLSKDSPYLWQLPVKIFIDNTTWYNRKSGVRTIKKFMKTISQKCQLSTMYTNHCVRATTCTLLGEIYSDINVQSVSGHKSLSGLSQYKRINDSQKISMSQSLSDTLGLTNGNQCQHSVISTMPMPSTTGLPQSGMNLVTSQPNKSAQEVSYTEDSSQSHNLTIEYSAMPMEQSTSAHVDCGITDEEWNSLLNSLDEHDKVAEQENPHKDCCISFGSSHQAVGLMQNTLNHAIKKGNKICFLQNCHIDNFNF
jgi:hypothetical protein